MTYTEPACILTAVLLGLRNISDTTNTVLVIPQMSTLLSDWIKILMLYFNEMLLYTLKYEVAFAELFMALKTQFRIEMPSSLCIFGISELEPRCVICPSHYRSLSFKICVRDFRIDGIAVIPVFKILKYLELVFI